MSESTNNIGIGLEFNPNVEPKYSDSKISSHSPKNEKLHVSKSHSADEHVLKRSSSKSSKTNLMTDSPRNSSSSSQLNVKLLVNKLGEAYTQKEFVKDFYEVFFVFSPHSRSRFLDVEKQEVAMKGLLSGLINTMRDPVEGFRRMEYVRDKHQGMGIKPEEFDMFVKSLALMLKRKLTLNEEEAQRIDYCLQNVKDFMLEGSYKKEKSGCNVM